MIGSNGLTCRTPRMSCNLPNTTTNVEPEALLASRIRKSAVLGRSEFIILSPRLRQNLLQIAIMKLSRYAHTEQNLTHGVAMNGFSILQSQGMPREPGGPQQTAQPLPVP
jgi:hypothetical protein